MVEENESEIPKDLGSPEGIRTVANYLRSSNGVKIRSGQQMDKRVDYFKGTSVYFFTIKNNLRQANG